MKTFTKTYSIEYMYKFNFPDTKKDNRFMNVKEIKINFPQKLLGQKKYEVSKAIYNLEGRLVVKDIKA